MPTEDDRLVIALLAVPDITASTIYGMFDVFASAGRDWTFVTTGTPGEQLVRPLVVTVDGSRFRAANGVWIQPDCALTDSPNPDIVCILEVFVAPDDDISGRYVTEIGWLTAYYQAGATLAAACSGAVLLAEAGLLDGQDATTHWGYCDVLATRYPQVNVHPSRVLVASGDEQRIVTSGGGTSWQDLALYLIARVFGPEEAVRLAKIYLMDWHQNGQLPFAALARSRQVEDREIAACQEWIGENYGATRPVAAMAEMSGLPESSFKRRFGKVTGMTPAAYRKRFGTFRKALEEAASEAVG